MHERAICTEVLRERSMAAYHGKVEPQLRGDADREVDAAPGDQHDAHAASEGPVDGATVAFGDVFGWVQERAVEVECNEVDAHSGPSRFRFPKAGPGRARPHDARYGTQTRQ